MSQQNTSGKWQGPSVQEMVATHTLAKEIMDRHKQAYPVFDDERILELRGFVQDPTSAKAFLRDHDMEDQSENTPGAVASQKRSLTGRIMATWGSDKSLLSADEVGALKKWFDGGGGKTDAELQAAQTTE